MTREDVAQTRAPSAPRAGRRAKSAPTIYDIARLAEVNPSTVSRALSQPGRINVKTEQRILSAAKELNYRMNPMARALPTKSAAMAKQHLNNCLHHVIGDYTIEQLCQPGIHRKLEREVRQLARTRLEPMGYNVIRVMVEAVHMPKHVMQALEEAHGREMQAENEARALERLQRVVSQFSKDDMERLMELERIHMMGKHGIPVMYPAMAEQVNLFDPRRRGQVVDMAVSS